MNPTNTSWLISGFCGYVRPTAQMQSRSLGMPVGILGNALKLNDEKVDKNKWEQKGPNNVAPQWIDQTWTFMLSLNFFWLPVLKRCLLQMDKRKDPSSVDIQSILLDMRKYRMGLIQTHDQLRFSYMAVFEGAKYIMGDSSVQVAAPHTF